LQAVVVAVDTLQVAVVRVVYYTIRTNPYRDRKQLLLVLVVPVDYGHQQPIELLMVKIRRLRG
jgi:hypothetical protein